MPAEVQAVNAALVSLLAADVTLQGFLGNPARIYQALAPEATSYPYLRYQVLSAVDVNAISPRRTHTIYVYYLEAVAQGANTTQIGSVLARVDVLLYGTRQTPMGYVLDWLREEQVGPQRQVIAGADYVTMGQRWRAWLQSVA
jgi:hypothetical protein